MFFACVCVFFRESAHWGVNACIHDQLERSRTCKQLETMWLRKVCVWSYVSCIGVHACCVGGEGGLGLGVRGWGNSILH